MPEEQKKVVIDTPIPTIEEVGALLGLSTDELEELLREVLTDAVKEAFDEE
jgi:hypothetical protein